MYRLCVSAISFIAAMSAGCPKICTGRTAFVLAVIFASIFSGSILYVSFSISANTGTAPIIAMASAVAKNVNGVVMTSSPGATPNAFSAITSASVPLFTATACLTPIYAAKSFSKSATASPPI